MSSSAPTLHDQRLVRRGGMKRPPQQQHHAERVVIRLHPVNVVAVDGFVESFGHGPEAEPNAVKKRTREPAENMAAIVRP